MKKLALIIWLLGLLTSICFGNGLRASDFAYGSIVFILQATIAYVTFVVILKKFLKRKRIAMQLKVLQKFLLKLYLL